MRKIKALAGVAAALILGTTASADTAEKIMKDGEPYYRFTVEDWNEVWDVPEQMMTVYDLTGDSSVTTQEITAQAYQITGLTFEDAVGHKTSWLTANGRVRGISVIPQVNNAPEAVAIVAVYRKGVLDTLGKVIIPAGKPLGIEYTFSVGLPLGGNPGELEIKAYVFNSLSAIQPMAASISRSNAQNTLTVTGNGGSLFHFILSATQDTIYELTFNPGQIQMVSGYNDKIHIVELSEGKLTFIPSRTSVIVDIPFRFLADYSGRTALGVQIQGGGAQ